jgi:hypothetical protein
MADLSRGSTAHLPPQHVTTTIDPYHHPIMAGEVGWLTKTLAQAIDRRPPEIREAWQARIQRMQGDTTEALLPSIAMLTNWIVETRLRQALVDGLRRGDLIPMFGPEATSPTWTLSAQGQARALDLVDWLEQMAVAPLRRGHQRLDAPGTTDDAHGGRSQPN